MAKERRWSSCGLPHESTQTRHPTRRKGARSLCIRNVTVSATCARRFWPSSCVSGAKVSNPPRACDAVFRNAPGPETGRAGSLECDKRARSGRHCRDGGPRRWRFFWRSQGSPLRLHCRRPQTASRRPGGKSSRPRNVRKRVLSRPWSWPHPVREGMPPRRQPRRRVPQESSRESLKSAVWPWMTATFTSLTEKT